MYIEYIPKALLDDITSNRCIPFIGAGFSKNAKMSHNVSMPDWIQLGKIISEYLSSNDYESPIEILSQYESKFSRANLTEILAKELQINNVSPGEVHKAFCRLHFDIMCTTNFDSLLERAYESIFSNEGKPYRVITNENSLSTFFNEKTTLLKLHGDFSDPTKMVVTENDYDTYISNNPLFCTYVANLLITRTPLLIGYSFNDPDLRMLWALIGSRLNTLRRVGYVILCSATENDVMKFKRRGINVINLPVKISEYSRVLKTLFDELYEYWNSKTEEKIKTSNEQALDVIKVPDNKLSDLCFFSVPYSKLSLYKQYVFPIVEKYGMIPMASDEFIVSGDNLNAKISTLIRKASFAIIDLTSKNDFILMEYGMLCENKIPFLIIGDDRINSQPLLAKTQLTIQSDFENNLDIFLSQVEDAVSNFLNRKQETNREYLDEPKRLFDLKEYNSAVISSIRLLQIELSKMLMRYDNLDYNNNTVIPLTQLIQIIQEKSGIDIDLMLIKNWSSVRNQIVHSDFNVARQQAKKIVDGVYKVISKLN